MQFLENNLQQNAEFFKLSDSSNFELTLVKQDLQKQFANTNAVDSFLKWHGQPFWAYAILYKKDNNHFKFFIPTKKDNVNKITTFFIADYSNGKISYEMHRRSSLNNGWAEQSRYNYKPFDCAKIITYFDNAVLHRTDTIFLNNSLDGQYNSILPVVPPTAATTSPLANPQQNTYGEFCWDVYIPCTPVSTTNASIRCFHTVTYCQLVDIDDGDGGGGGAPPTGGGGSGGGSTPPSGGGGSGGGNDPLPEPCPTSNVISQNGDAVWYSNHPILVDPCGNPIPAPPDTPDANGFYPSRIAELNNILQQDPFALEPCDSLTLINLQSYGSMWQNVALFIPSQVVINRLDSIRQEQGGWIVDNFNIQSLEEAYGSVVNCDYFPLQITQFPINYLTGQHYTPSEFLEYFRLNIDDFIKDPVTVHFSCNFSPSFDDCIKWNQPYANALGSLNSIYIPGNSGDVILSDYQINNNAGIEQDKFKFSTLETPFDFEHPVAGNREFGIFNTQANPNQYTFYTMGVDRVWDWGAALENLFFNGFKHADELWYNIQSNMKKFINDNGGNANFYNQKSYIARPNWDDVKDYLKKLIDFPTLKQRLGC
ncbi:MAG: hypothetical protein JSU03_11010 [Bacteroidetes bacterium]|nr:hypothetical protein [Bacteroidota bacterium]MBS1757799.1 hypothetical protein [Bacteroidota bacterium]